MASLSILVGIAAALIGADFRYSLDRADAFRAMVGHVITPYMMRTIDRMETIGQK